MVKVVLTVAALLLCENLCPAHAQKRVEAGLLLDYLRVSQTQTNNFGVGGRFGYRVHRNVMAEGEPDWQMIDVAPASAVGGRSTVITVDVLLLQPLPSDGSI